MPRRARRLNSALLNAALEGLALQKQRIDEQIRTVQALIGRKAKAAAAPKAAAPAGRRARKPLSAAARRRISLAQKRRWAEYRKRTAGKE